MYLNGVHAINAKNNIEFLRNQLEELYDNDELHKIDFTAWYSQVANKRLRSTSESLFELYQDGDITFSQFKMYLEKIETIKQSTFKTVELSMFEGITKHTTAMKRILMTLDSLSELLNRELE